jgi:hypothetical protein
MDIDIQDLKNYWIKIIPEINAESELKVLVEKASEFNIDNLAIRLINKKNNYDFSELLNEDKFERLDTIISDFRSMIPFYFFYEPFINKNLNKWFYPIKELNIIEDIDAMEVLEILTVSYL